MTFDIHIVKKELERLIDKCNQNAYNTYVRWLYRYDTPYPLREYKNVFSDAPEYIQDILMPDDNQFSVENFVHLHFYFRCFNVSDTGSLFYKMVVGNQVYRYKEYEKVISMIKRSCPYKIKIKSNTFIITQEKVIFNGKIIFYKDYLPPFTVKEVKYGPQDSRVHRILGQYLWKRREAFADTWPELMYIHPITQLVIANKQMNVFQFVSVWKQIMQDSYPEEIAMEQTRDLFEANWESERHKLAKIVSRLMDKPLYPDTVYRTVVSEPSLSRLQRARIDHQMRMARYAENT